LYKQFCDNPANFAFLKTIKSDFMSETIMERLRNETKTAHQQLEKATIPYIKQSTDEASYGHVLRMFYGYFSQVEEQIQALIDESVLEDIKERRQSAAIIADLKSIGAATENLATANELPVLKTVPQALGAMYVLEGSTLGGRFISQMLAKQLNRTAADGISFFSGYGEQTDTKWKKFTEMMNEYVINHPLNANEIVAAANETFSKFGVWSALCNEKLEVIN
jgi:heme oxygenase